MLGIKGFIIFFENKNNIMKSDAIHIEKYSNIIYLHYIFLRIVHLFNVLQRLQYDCSSVQKN